MLETTLSGILYKILLEGQNNVFKDGRNPLQLWPKVFIHVG